MKKIEFKLLLMMFALVATSLFAQTPPPALKWGAIDTRMGSAIDVVGIHAFGADTVIACGANGSILKSVDAGLNWKSVAVIRGFTEINFVDKNVGYIAATKQIHKTVDGGESWNLIYEFDPSNPNILSLSLIDADTLYAVLQCGRDCVSKLMKSIDGGKSWMEKFVTKEPQYFYGMWINDAKFIDNVGYLITSEVPDQYNHNGDNYTYSIYKSTDYADTWDSISGFKCHYFYHACEQYKLIDFPPRPVFLFPKNQDTVTVYTEEKDFITNDGFVTFDTVDNIVFVGGWDRASMKMQSDGRASFVYQYGSRLPYGGPGFQYSYVYFTEDYGNTWMLGDKQTDSPYVDDLGIWRKNVAYCATRANDTVFYAGWNYGNIRRSPSLPTTSLTEIESLAINVYPNPVENELQIDGGELKLKEIEIYDLTGRKVKSVSCNNQFQLTIPTSDLKRGMYLLKIYTEKEAIVVKINKK